MGKFALPKWDTNEVGDKICKTLFKVRIIPISPNIMKHSLTEGSVRSLVFLTGSVMNFKWRPILSLIYLKYTKYYSNYVLPSKSAISYKNFNSVMSKSIFYHTHCSQRIVSTLDKKVVECNEANGNEKENSLKSLKYSLLCLGFGIATIGSFLFLKYGSPRIDDSGNIIQDEYTELPVWQQYIYRCMDAIRTLTLFIQQPSREKLLPDPLKPPYHQPPYTLILELTNVLVHPDWTYKTGWRFKKRPGLDHLLENLVGLYEIVIFTAEQGIIVFPLCEALDPKNLISYKLVRDATHFIDGHHVKNLDKLNRDLSKVIAIDFNDESLKLHGDNLLNIGSWNGDDDDVLIDLTSFLTTIAQNQVEDVREVLKYYKTFKNPLATFRQKQKEIFEEKHESITMTQPKIKRKYFF
ncbi:mitochondrial import inner membrane translocase subunit TIM50-C-like [Coccinella septempunctata]|uniref:mitochondrial import inner membrane translocase subunit TIM50-C-like n=1 Tax=Coccinella septempunctata TaxID=41139 RepID=UPI001D08814C|nr:mitochondrial import inner membrane translocase subunit TIM50-C-like [Coccinella septempunctata]